LAGYRRPSCRIHFRSMRHNQMCPSLPPNGITLHLEHWWLAWRMRDRLSQSS
jgi:hypothetical protein